MPWIHGNISRIQRRDKTKINVTHFMTRNFHFSILMPGANTALRKYEAISRTESFSFGYSQAMCLNPKFVEILQSWYNYRLG